MNVETEEFRPRRSASEVPRVSIRVWQMMIEKGPSMSDIYTPITKWGKLVTYDDANSICWIETSLTNNDVTYQI